MSFSCGVQPQVTFFLILKATWHHCVRQGHCVRSVTVSFMIARISSLYRSRTVRDHVSQSYFVMGNDETRKFRESLQRVTIASSRCGGKIAKTLIGVSGWIIICGVESDTIAIARLDSEVELPRATVPLVGCRSARLLCN